MTRFFYYFAGLIFVAINLQASCKGATIDHNNGKGKKEIVKVVDKYEFYKKHLLKEWKLDSVTVGEYTIPAKIIAFESYMEFTDDGTLIATTGNIKRYSRYTLLKNTITSYPIEEKETPLEIIIQSMTEARLEVSILDKGQNTFMILKAKP